MEKEIIVDCHSNIGNDYYWRDANIDEYVNIITDQKIDVGLLMPVPGQTIPDNHLKRFLIWSVDEKMKIKYLSDSLGNEIVNPYKEVNEYVSKLIINKKTNKRLEFIPLIHPTFDTPEYILSLVERYHPLALKIHGVACGIGPNDISKEIIKVLKEMSLPIIVHTDYCMNPKMAIEYMRQRNNPYDWAMFFLKNDLEGYLTHGCRMDFRTFNLVNKYNNLVVGIGPDLKISYERNRWVNSINDKEYLQILKNELEISKIMFDIDYSWNIDYNRNIDCRPIDRMSDYFDNDEKYKVLSKNPERFFKMKERL